MTQDEIIEMAKEARLFYGDKLTEDYAYKVKRFAKLVAAKEREACAKVCEDISPKTEPVEYGDIRWGWKYKCPYAAAIRARGEA